MSLRWRSSWAGPVMMAAFLALAPAATAQEKFLGAVTIKSLDGLMSDVKYVLKLAGQESRAQEIDGLIQALTGGQGFAGVDMKRPLGVLVGLPQGKDSPPPAVLFIPITKEDEFLGFLKQVNLEPAKAEGNMHQVPLPTGQTLYLRFANGYAYGADNSDRLKGNLPDPSKAIPAGHKNVTLAATIRFDQLPSELKQMAIKELDESLGREKDKLTGKPDFEKRIAETFLKMARQAIAEVIQNSKDVSFTFNVDQSNNLFTTDLVLTAQPGSQLAAALQGLAGGKSMFAGLAQDAAARLLVDMPIPPQLKELQKHVLAALGEMVKKEDDAKKRNLGERLLTAIEPSAQLNEIHQALVLRGPLPDGTFVALAARNVKEGKKLEQFVRELRNEVPIPENEVHVKLDHVKHGDVAIHLIQPQKVADPELKRVFGAADICLAFRDDALFITFGKHAVTAMKEALDGVGKTAAQSAPIDVEFSVSKLSVLSKENQEKIQDAVKKVFAGADKGKDKVRVTLRGTKDSLRLNATVNAEIVKVAAEFIPGQ